MIIQAPNRRGFDAVRPDGRAIAEIKFGVEALRTIRSALLGLAYALRQRPGARAYLVLVAPGVTDVRLRAEWRRACAVLKAEVVGQLAICVAEGDEIRGIPRDPPEEDREWLNTVLRRESALHAQQMQRTDYEFVIVKLLLHQWLLGREPVTASSLARTAGCSYPTVARVLKNLGSAVERENRRVSLRGFPQEQLSLLLAKAPKARSTLRYADRSGKPRSPDAHLARLAKLDHPEFGIGGVVGARHYLPSLDLVGTPRLDISAHCPESSLDVGFIQALDPALERVDDPQSPASVVVHAVRHADPLFVPRGEGLFWADPVECLLDLHEARLEAQATEFLDALQKGSA